MDICIAGATGFVGEELVEQLLATNHNLTVLGRSKKKIQEKFGNRVCYLDWETIGIEGADILAAYDTIINLSGANIASERWSEARKEIITQSRTQTTRILTLACARLHDMGKSPTLLNASAIGIYPAYEQLQTAPSIEGDAIQEPTLFLQQVALAWEAACKPAADAGCRVVNMRFAVVLDKSGGMLMHLLKPYAFGLGAKLGSGQQPFPWISRNDLCRAIQFIMHNPSINGAINLVAPERVTQEQFSRALAKNLKRPHFLRLPAGLLKKVFAEMANELLLTGADVSCQKLLESGFQFEDDTLGTFFSSS